MWLPGDQAMTQSCNTIGFSSLSGISADSIRLGFVRKVYGVVCTQVAVTIATAILCVHGPLREPITGLVSARPSLYVWGTFIATTASLVALRSFKKRYPWNIYALGLFTAVLSIDVGIVCIALNEAGLGAALVQAAAVTGLLFLGLTLYAFVSKRDFSMLGATLFPLLLALSILGLASIPFPSLRIGIVGLVYSVIGAAVFCGYMVFDTFRIMRMLQPDDYVEGAIQLYLDIINLFLYLLDLIVKMKRRRDRGHQRRRD
eukprot:TRINITY_DN77750_c0_g1_i1.p1 TRINITY_DN77750_c0_g1~~TRINITY_DN77750_c0_g1_i1.p1  ORF type:complete len:259 (+),score=31.55 TRINITY_DN77750_c0_g1_i1:25-801(+)